MAPQVASYHRLALSLKQEIGDDSEPMTPRSVSEKQKNIYIRAKGVSQGLYHLNSLSCLLFVLYSSVAIVEDGNIRLLPVLVTNLFALLVGVATFAYQQQIMSYVKLWEATHMAQHKSLQEDYEDERRLEPFPLPSFQIFGERSIKPVTKP